jgi:hypothetical protein
MNRRRFQYYQIKKRTERGEKVGKNGCWLKGQSQNPTKALKKIEKKKTDQPNKPLGNSPTTKPNQNKTNRVIFCFCCVLLNSFLWAQNLQRIRKEKITTLSNLQIKFSSFSPVSIKTLCPNLNQFFNIFYLRYDGKNSIFSIFNIWVFLFTCPIVFLFEQF